MVEVAKFFSTTSALEKAVEKSTSPRFIININDMLEERGFQGRFAALIVAVVNIRTGECFLCNAGDILSTFTADRETGSNS
jgi:serine phosphatase RsbU (regulator of sigma subunit)